MLQHLQIRLEIDFMHKDSEVIPLWNGEPPRYTSHDDSPPLTGNTSEPSKSIEPWNIIHTVNNSYTGFILPRTYDTHQWLPLQFVNYSWWWTQTASETCRVIKNQINRKSCMSLVIYKTRLHYYWHLQWNPPKVALLKGFLGKDIIIILYQYDQHIFCPFNVFPVFVQW